MRATTKSSKQNPAERQKADGLPEGNELQSEQRRRQPVPQQHYYGATKRDEDHYPDDRRGNHPN
jgi:hypothetical protein